MVITKNNISTTADSFNLMLKLNLIQSATHPDALNTNILKLMDIQWIISFQISDRITISITLWLVKKLLKKLLDTNGIGKNNQMAHHKTTLFQTSELMRILKTFLQQSKVRKVFKVIPGPQHKMLTDSGVFQKLLITHHMVITQNNTSTIVVSFKLIQKPNLTQSVTHPDAPNTNIQKLMDTQWIISFQISDKITISTTP